MPKGDRERFKADCEDGYTKIANLLLEALAMCKINGTQKGICLFLFRRTYGWGKAEDAISLADFAASCGTSKPYISRQLQQLLKKNIIKRVSYQPGKTPIYKFNTRVIEWDRGCIDVEGLSDCIKQGLYEQTKAGLSECTTVNESQTQDLRLVEPPGKKELKKKKENIYFPPDSKEYILSEYLLKKILSHLPGCKNPDLQKWAKHMNAILKLDKRDPEEVRAVIDFAQDDSFWRNNILSVEKLRKQYDQLNAKRINERGSPYRGNNLFKREDGDDEYAKFFD